MPLVNAKCTNCGANLKVDSGKDAAICEYCGTAFIVEKAVNNYNVINNNNINASVVNMYGSQITDFQIRAGKLEKYTGESTTVTIPDTVSVIGQHAFEGCSGLIQVTIPDSVTIIEECAFRYCENLESVDIPASVVEIKHNAFCSCRSLSQVTIPGSIKSIGIYSEPFSSCTGLKEIIFLNGIEAIDTTAFNGCFNIRRFVIPDSVTKFENLKIEDNRPYARIYGIEELVASDATKVRLGKELASLKRGRPVGSHDTGCYIATCIYGSYDCPQVRTLRRFRDNSLAASWYGRAFVRIYYTVSPTLVKWFGNTTWFKDLWTPVLNKMVNKLNAEGVESTPYSDIIW